MPGRTGKNYLKIREPLLFLTCIIKPVIFFLVTRNCNNSINLYNLMIQRSYKVDFLSAI